MAITSTEFEFVRQLVRAEAGIVLETGKEYLVEARLAPILREAKFETITQLNDRIKASSFDPLRRRVIEAMTTNETSFFRDLHPFEALKKHVLPELIAKRSATKSLSIWCAASSSGQEPYTIAMTLLDAIPRLADWTLKFIATDISTEMIARSRAGKYNQIEVNRGLPATLLVKHFEKVGLEWQVKKPLRDMIEFRELNLTQPFTGLPHCDIVFIRNVLIYFNSETKTQIFEKVRRVLKPDGYLFLGGAETTMGLDDAFTRVPVERSGCYRLKSAMSKAA